eukprot:2600826-Ditylum_brightwellii.AAC.1
MVRGHRRRFSWQPAREACAAGDDDGPRDPARVGGAAARRAGRGTRGAGAARGVAYNCSPAGRAA